MARTPEKIVKDKVDDLLRKYHVWYFKPVSVGFGVQGIPDYICCVQGRFLAIECKAQDNMRPTELQAATMLRMEEAGGVVFVATPGSLLALENLLIVLEAHATRT